MRSSTKWLSPTLRREPEARLRFSSEFKLYRDATRGFRLASDRRLVSRLAAKIRFDRGVKTITAMPVVVSEENLRRALLCYTRQGHWLRSHRLVLFLNADHRIAPRKYRGLLKLRIREIEMVRAEFPALRIQYVERHLSAGGMGRVRGLLVDAVAEAAARCGLKDAIVISNDADQWALSKSYLRRIVGAFSRRPGLDGGEGILTFGDPAINREIPELALNNRYLRCLERLRGGSNSRALVSLHFWGANSFYRLSSYCAVGGYDYRLKAREDFDLAMKIEAARATGWGHFLCFYGKAISRIPARATTDPRRLLQAILEGKTLLQRLHRPSSRLRVPETEKLASAYRQRKQLLQKDEIEQALRGDPRRLAKFRRRIESIFMGNLRVDPFFHPSYAPQLGRDFGLRLEPIRVVDRKWGFPEVKAVSVDWSRSSILRRFGTSRVFSRSSAGSLSAL